MTELNIPQRLGRLFVAALVCAVYGWGIQFLPKSYQPSRPIYTFGWLAACAVIYIALRRRGAFVGSLAGFLAIIFGMAFVATLFMRN